jgi:hypothetical protein
MAVDDLDSSAFTFALGKVHLAHPAHSETAQYVPSPDLVGVPWGQGLRHAWIVINPLDVG